MQKKILFLIHTLGGGGAEKVLVNLANNLSNDYDVTVMTVIDTGIYKKSLSNNVKYKSMIKLPKFSNSNSKNESGSLLNKTSSFKKCLSKIYTFFWKFIPTKILYKLKIKEKYDVEIAFLEGICAKIISSSNNENSKKYAWIHIDVINENKSDHVFANLESAKKCYKKFDNIVAVSNEVKNQFVKKYSFDAKKVIVKHNVIDSNEIKEKSLEKLDYNLSKYFNIITIGRLSKQKGYDRLLRVVKKLKKENLKFHLYIIGVGPMEDELKNYVIDNSIDDMITFLGYQKNPYKYLKQSDLFVCSSRAEGFSTVACEASILSIPIITTNCSGMYELLGDSEYGMIVENDEESLYDGLKELLYNKEKYNYYKNQAKKLKDRFDIQQSVKEVEELFGD